MFKKALILLSFITLLTSCGAKKQTYTTRAIMPVSNTENIEPFIDITEYSENEDYGLTGEFPVKVGDRSATNQQRFIASLAGPNGEALSFTRKGSCCGYKSENGFGGVALVDVYEVTYPGLKKPVMLYISFYDFEKLYIPKGFTQRKL